MRARLCVFLLIALGPAVAQAENPLLEQMLRDGVSCRGLTVKLPAPALDDSLDAAQQRAAVKSAAAKYGLDQFLRDSIVAPFVLTIEPLKRDGERIGHAVDLWFVAYGSLEAVRDRQLLSRLVTPDSSDAGGEGNRLNESELASRGLTALAQDNLESGFFRYQFSLFKKIELSGVAEGVLASHPAKLSAAMRIDPRFDQDAQFPNQWRPLKSEGTAEAGRPRTFSDFSGYAQAIALKDPAGALFIECHAVFHEPPDWFDGANLFRSKLPLLVQDNVRSFRRALRKDPSAAP